MAEAVEVFSGDYGSILDAVSFDRLRNIVPRLSLSSTDRVLDVACGTGILAPMIAPLVREYVGIDYSQSLIDIARRRAIQTKSSNVEFFCTDVESYVEKITSDESRIAAKPFTKIFAFDFTGYLTDVECVQMFSQLKQILDKDGVLIIYIANRVFFLELLKTRGLFRNNKAPYTYLRTPNETADLLRKGGLMPVEVSHAPHYNVLKYFDVLSNLPIVGENFKAKIFVKSTPQ